MPIMDSNMDNSVPKVDYTRILKNSSAKSTPMFTKFVSKSGTKETKRTFDNIVDDREIRNTTRIEGYDEVSTPYHSGLKDPNLSLCYMYVYYNKEYFSTRLPVYPESISDNTSANWSDQTIVGRSSPISAFSSTSDRQISFSFTLHREMEVFGSSAVHYRSIDDIIAVLRSSVYPKYYSAGLLPPITMFRFGNFYAKGKVTSVGFQWKPPIINGNYQLCEVSVSMNCSAVNDGKVLGASDIINNERTNFISPMNPFRRG